MMICVKQLMVPGIKALVKEVVVVGIVLLKCLFLHVINVQDLKHMFTIFSSLIQQISLDH